MLVQHGSGRHGLHGGRSRLAQHGGPGSEGRQDHLRCWWSEAKGRVWADGVVEHGLRTPTGPLYPWHPWCGLQVAVHEATTRADGIAFRCTLTGSGGDRWLEVPAWMFDRATCPDQARLTAMPSVSLIALTALAKLLRQASSSAPHPGASSSSHEQIRREGVNRRGIGTPCRHPKGTPYPALISLR